MTRMEEGVIEKVLTVQDRCDLCPSQAYFLAIYDQGELYFCNHHFRKHEDGLRESAYYIIDQSEDLEAR